MKLHTAYLYAKITQKKVPSKKITLFYKESQAYSRIFLNISLISSNLRPILSFRYIL
ncbi:unknown [Prevotella sp. CAG:1124]|nr:unknown [Prevotella sp. CAG:1124]